MSKLKLKYGFKILLNELNGNTDYWHPRLKHRKCSIEELKKYYFLDFTIKGHYPFKLEKGIPLVEMNGEKREFSITIFNYGIGLLDLYHNGEENIDKIKSVLAWALKNQEADGAWRNYYDVPFLKLKKGWSSAMGQGLAISFIVRCHYLGLLNSNETAKVIDNAFSHMLSEDLNQKTPFGYILQEFGGTETNVLNGFIFALWGIWDYENFKKTDNVFNDFIPSLKNLILNSNYFSNWSYYSSTKIISSSFYHQLHIDMLKSVYSLTGQNFFLQKANKWKRGLKYRTFFIIIKAIQKLRKFDSINTLN